MELLKKYWHRWAFMIILLALIGMKGNLIALVVLLAYFALRLEVLSIVDSIFPEVKR